MMSLLDSYNSTNYVNPSPELTTPKANYKRVSLPSISTLFPNHFPTELPSRRASLDSYSGGYIYLDNDIGVKGKRKRANSIQICYLNRVFETTAFPSTELRNELGKQLGMSPRAVQIWFQNKRQSLRGHLPHGSRDHARRVSISLHGIESNLLPTPIQLHTNVEHTFFH